MNLAPGQLLSFALPAVIGLALLGASGCAKEPVRPPYRELEVPAADPAVRPDPAESDVRTITDTEDEPEGPISPTGTELPPDSPRSQGLPFDAPVPAGSSRPPILAADFPESADVADPSSAPEPGAAEAADEDAAGGYRTIGGVLGEVNGHAIFTDEVIALRRNELRGLARKLPAEQFQQAAAQVVMNELGGRLQNELSLAVFERYTDERERELARNLTTLWRQRFITDNGGSEAIARERALERSGKSLDRLGEDIYRERLGQIFMQKRIAPQARPSASELREAYREGVERGRFTQIGGIDFSLIEIRPESTDSTAVAAARAKAESLRERAAAGEDFAELATQHSDNEAYAERGGRLPEAMIPLQKGAYAIAVVDDAAWATAEGEVAPVVEVGEGERQRFYVVKVNQKQESRTLSFTEVQSRLAGELTSLRQQELTQEYVERERQRLDLPSAEQQNRMMQTAIEVLMQNYDAWREE